MLPIIKIFSKVAWARLLSFALKISRLSLNPSKKKKTAIKLSFIKRIRGFCIGDLPKFSLVSICKNEL
nr:hypothetical protein [Campylobacter concisus]